MIIALYQNDWELRFIDHTSSHITILKKILLTG